MLARQTGFIIPVIGGEIQLPKRHGSVYADCFAAVGGASEPAPTKALWTPAVVNGSVRVGFWDYLCITNYDRINLPEAEAPVLTAVREVAEEMYCGISAQPIHDVFHLGYTKSNDSKYWLHHYLATLEGPFSLDSRVLSELTPISQLTRARIAPATTNALRAVGILLKSNTESFPQVYRKLVLPLRWSSALTADFEIQEPLYFSEFSPS